MSWFKKQSSEVKGVKCSVCNVWLPPSNADWDAIKACEFSKQATYCFWTTNESDTSISTTITYSASVDGKVGLTDASVGGSAGISRGANTTVRAGARLFKYFRNENYDPYYCSKCFAQKDVHQAESVFLELAGKGIVVSKDFQLVRAGGRL